MSKSLNNNFIKLNKDIITEYSGKEILVLWYIHNHYVSINNQCSFYLKDLISTCTYSPHYNKTNKEFIEVLNKLQEQNIISIDQDIHNKKLIILRYKYDDKNKTYFNNIRNFVLCYSDEVERILFAKENNDIQCKVDILLQVFYYLKSFTYEINNLRYCYPSISRIAKDLKISRTTVQKSIDDLTNLNLIFKYNFKAYYDKNNTKYIVPNIYAFEPYDDRKLQIDYASRQKNLKCWC